MQGNLRRIAVLSTAPHPPGRARSWLSAPANRACAARSAAGKGANKAIGAHVQMGPALLPTPLAPVAVTGVSPVRAPERAFSGYVARRSRRHPVPSGGWSGAEAPFLPAWRFRGRAIRGGPALHLSGFRPKPFPFHPRRAGFPGLRQTCPRVSSVEPRVHPEIFAIPPVSKPRSFRRRVETFRSFLVRSGLAAFPIPVRLSGFDKWMMCPAGESHKAGKPDLSTFCGFSGG